MFGWYYIVELILVKYFISQFKDVIEGVFVLDIEICVKMRVVLVKQCFLVV